MTPPGKHSWVFILRLQLKKGTGVLHKQHLSKQETTAQHQPCNWSADPGHVLTPKRNIFIYVCYAPAVGSPSWPAWLLFSPCRQNTLGKAKSKFPLLSQRWSMHGKHLFLTPRDNAARSHDNRQGPKSTDQNLAVPPSSRNCLQFQPKGPSPSSRWVLVLCQTRLEVTSNNVNSVSTLKH